MDTPPPATTPARENRLREQLVTLAAGCPHTRSNPSSCPLHEVRKLEPVTIIGWLDGLSHQEKDFLMLYHQCCLVINQESASSGGPRG